MSFYSMCNDAESPSEVPDSSQKLLLGFRAPTRVCWVYIVKMVESCTEQ
jgi:hypothetical protein